MLSILSNIQKRPEKEKRKFALISSGIITAVIVLVWIIALTSSAGDTPPAQTDVEKPLVSIKDSLSSVFADTAMMAKEVREVFKGQASTTEDGENPQK